MRLRDDVATVTADPSWATVDELQVCGYRTRADVWRDLLLGTPRAFRRLHFALHVDEDWDQDGDITATPQSGGVWTTTVDAAQLAALATCAALPALRTLVVHGAPADAIARLRASPIAARATLTFVDGQLPAGKLAIS